ncbi:phage tail protein [Spirosoma spitsbergense]|uniref:phage tail protein n=1 Tax=Spirosoma spitsbergense TaxID=431554 RepID=UPI00036FCEA4|nr:phage tail protein [Spirosoma spitsbergense]
MTIYPAVGFYFSVTFDPKNPDSDNGFQEVSGVSVTLPTEEVQEGGLNRYKHKVPGVPAYTNLVLKRGYVTSDSNLVSWFKKTLSAEFSEPIITQTITLMLLNENGTPLKIWTFHDAWPVKWSISDFNAQENKLALESLEFAYSFFDV